MLSAKSCTKAMRIHLEETLYTYTCTYTPQAAGHFKLTSAVPVFSADTCNVDYVLLIIYISCSQPTGKDHGTCVYMWTSHGTCVYVYIYMYMWTSCGIIFIRPICTCWTSCTCYTADMLHAPHHALPFPVHWLAFSSHCCSVALVLCRPTPATPLSSKEETHHGHSVHVPCHSLWILDIVVHPPSTLQMLHVAHTCGHATCGYAKRCGPNLTFNSPQSLKKLNNPLT